MRLPRPISIALDVFNKWLRIVLKPFQIVSNFVFLTVSYFLGIGLSSFFYKLGPGKKKAALQVDSYWQPVQPAPKDKESWLRPF